MNSLLQSHPMTCTLGLHIICVITICCGRQLLLMERLLVKGVGKHFVAGWAVPAHGPMAGGSSVLPFFVSVKLEEI